MENIKDEMLFVKRNQDSKFNILKYIFYTEKPINYKFGKDWLLKVYFFIFSVIEIVL